MKVNHIRQNVFPVLAALIWGTAFVAQSVAADHVGPFTFTAARSAGGLCVSAGAVSGVPLPAAAGFSGGGPGPARFLAGSGHRRYLLRRGPDNGHQPPADGAGDHHLRQGGVHHGPLYCHRAHCGDFPPAKGRPGRSGSVWRWRWWDCICCACRSPFPSRRGTGTCCCAPSASPDTSC